MCQTRLRSGTRELGQNTRNFERGISLRVLRDDGACRQVGTRRHDGCVGDFEEIFSLRLEEDPQSARVDSSDAPHALLLIAEVTSEKLS
jgi:hypothetical protein